nr:flagellar hook-basal body complex protein FliE [Endozoicomonas sp.]
PDSHQSDRFDRIFQQTLNHVNDTQLDAGQQMVALESGKDNLIETVLAIQKASQTMNMMIQVRNRLVEGYQEIFSQQI